MGVRTAESRAYYVANRARCLAYQAQYRNTHSEAVAMARHARARLVVPRFLANLRVLRMAQGCCECGKRYRWLVHHHRDPSTKLYDVSRMASYSLRAFIDEIAKCDVVCRRCHHLRHVALAQEAASSG